MDRYRNDIQGYVNNISIKRKKTTAYSRKEKDFPRGLQLSFQLSESLQMVTAAMKLKDTCSLEEKP